MKIILSRHSAHNNNIPTNEGIEKVKQNAKNILSNIQGEVINEDILVLSSKENRAKKTAEIIAEVLLGNDEIVIQEKEYLHFSPQKNENYNKSFGKIIESFKILNQEYLKYLNEGKLDDFVNKFHRNEILGVNFNDISAYYIKKLKQTIEIIKNKYKTPKIVIIGTHGGFIIESILYGLFSKEFPKEWEGHIGTGESSEIDIKSDGSEWFLNINYRGITKRIGEKELLNIIHAN